MILREFFKSKKIIGEGGNLSSQSPGWKGSQDVAADEIDLKVHNRSFMVKLLDKLLHDIDNAFKATYKKSLWSKELLQNKQFLGGSSLHFFNTKGISDEEFVKHKPKVGDIDTQCNKELEPEVEQFLNTITGKKVGDAVFLGFSRGNEQLNGLFEFEDPPIKIQIDFEFGRYSPETNAPDNWYKFSHSSAWNDVQAGIKGVMHKYLYRALAKAGPTTKYVAKLEGRGKARAMSISGPITDANFSFAVASAGGGGVRAKYKPYIDPETGQEKIIDSIPVMEPVNPADSEYIQNLSQQFALFFNHQPDQGDLQLQQSFLGTLDLINKYLDDAAKQNALKEFLTIVFEPGGQMITANDPARDREVKFAAIDSMIEKLGLGSMRAQSVQMAKDYEQDYHDVEAFKQANPNEKQPRAAMNRLKKATPVTEAGEVKAQLRKGMPHLRDLKPADFLDLVDELQTEGGGFKLQNIPLNVKIDGFGGRFGKNAEGKPFMGTSRTEPKYQAGFVKYHQEKGTTDPEILGRAANFDKLFTEVMAAIQMVDSKLGADFLVDKQVTCEVLFLPFATQTDEGKLKFVGIEYDQLPKNVDLVLVPYRIVDASTGEDVPDGDNVVQQIADLGQTGNVMFMSNRLVQKDGLDVTKIINPLENLDELKQIVSDTAGKRDRASLELRREVEAKLQPVQIALEKAIDEDPNIVGKDILGQDYEGIVINSRLGPIKVTSQKQKDIISQKNAAKATARADRGRENSNKTAVVAIGSFVGHKGHEDLFNYTINKANELNGDPYLFIGNAEGKDDPIPPAVKVQTWHKLYPEYSKNISTVQAGGSLIQKVKHELINPLPGKPPRYDNIVIMVGEDRAGMNMPTALMKAVNKFQGYEHVKASLEVTPRESGISGTMLRNSLKSDPPEKALAVWSKAFDVQKLGTDWIKHLMDVTMKGMGIQQPAQQPVLTQEPVVEQRLFNALLRPLKESTSIESTLRAIINDIGEPITGVYDTMKFQAKKYMENHGELGRGFRMVAAGVGGRWVQNMYIGRLHNELYALCKYNTRRTVDLKDFLRGEETDGELEMKRSFGNIANNLPPILAKLGEQLNVPQLTKNAQRWVQNKAEYERYIMDLEMGGDDESDDELVIKSPKSNVVGQQNAQVDKIVNDILSKIPKNIAGEIRNAIARSPNKLSALKQELDNHHLNMAEDKTADMRLWFASQDQNLPFRAKTSPSPRNYDYPKDIDDILKKIKNREGLSPHEFEYLKRWKSRQGVAEGNKKKNKKTSKSLSRYFFPGYGYYGSGESGESGGDGGEGVAESQLNELVGYSGDKNYKHLGTHKRYDVYVTKQKFNNLYFIAIAENPRTLEAKFKAKGNTPQEAVNNLKLEIDKEIDVATKVSGQAILDFNVEFAKDILELSTDVFYAKIIAGPRLVIAGPEMMEYPDIMRDEGFKPSAIRTYNGGEGTTKLPGVPLSSKSAASANLIANGRYVLGNEEIDKDGNRVFELNFDSVVQAKNDRMRLRTPALTVGTNRLQGTAEGLGKQIHGTFQSMGDSFGDAHLAKGISYFLQGRHQEGENMLRSKIPEKAQNIVFSKLKTLQAQSGLDVNKNPNIQKYIDDELVPWVKRQIQQGVAEAPKSAAVRLGRAIQRVQGKTAASQARSVIPSSIPKPEPKKDEKIAEKLKTGPDAHFTPKDAHVKRGQFVGGDAGSVDEEKQRLDPSCWKGYKKQGTKMKGDTKVNNCVPKESTNDDDGVIGHMAKNLTGSGSPIAKIRHKRDTEREKRGSISYGYRQDPNLKTTHKQVPFSEDINNIIDILINKIIVNEAISNN